MIQDQLLKPKDCYLDEKKYRHQCAVRQLIMWRRQWGLKAFREYMHKHKDKLGWELLRDFEDQWLKGNRADEKGEWK
jgi:hypothetical protein